MMSVAGAAFLAFGFIMLIKVLRLVQKSSEMLRVTKLAFEGSSES